MLRTSPTHREYPCVKQSSAPRTMVLGWFAYEKPAASPDSSAMIKIPSDAPTIDPTVAISALWNVAPRLLLKATTADMQRCQIHSVAADDHDFRAASTGTSCAKERLVVCPPGSHAVTAAAEGGRSD